MSAAQTLQAHPALIWWWGLWAVGFLAFTLPRPRIGLGRGLVVLALGTIVTASALPPPNGMVSGLARTCDLGTGGALLLWPWNWALADSRFATIALMAFAGAAAGRRGRWLLGAAALPVAVEAVQFLLPGLAGACSVPDVVHSWIGLATGAAVAALGRWSAPLLRLPRPRTALIVLVAVAMLLSVTAWTTRGVPDVDQPARQPLWGAEFHPTDGPQARARAWIAAGHPPGAETAYADMASVALWDLHLLTDQLPDGLPAAGPAEMWDYFWPRDGSFLAVALARSGHAGEAVQLLDGVADLHLDPLYGFDARYLLDGGRVISYPRGPQVDGCGWVLWAIRETALVTEVSPEVHGLRDRCTDHLLRATGGGSHLPAPSADYWERSTFAYLLGASAPIAAGLRAAGADYRDLGEVERANQVQQAATGVRDQIESAFGPEYLRAGDHGGLDAATAMLMPPFDPDPLPGVREAWLGYQEQALRPAGGLAPGTAWKQDGMSWTPEVALVAYTAAAAGEIEIAEYWLDWLDAHRAPWGSLPEKVDSAGMPSGPAPLGWTSALVILTLDELAP